MKTKAVIVIQGCFLRGVKYNNVLLIYLKIKISQSHHEAVTLTPEKEKIKLINCREGILMSFKDYCQCQCIYNNMYHGESGSRTLFGVKCIMYASSFYPILFLYSACNVHSIILKQINKINACFIHIYSNLKEQTSQKNQHSTNNENAAHKC